VAAGAYRRHCRRDRGGGVEEVKAKRLMPAGLVVGVLGQWASGKTEAARTLIRHLGGRDEVTFLSDRVLWISYLIQHVRALDDSEVSVSLEADERQRLDSELVTVWLRPGETLESVDPATLNAEIYDDDLLVAWRRRGKVELGRRLLAESVGRRPVVVEAAFGPNPEGEDENPYGRTISDLFGRLERAGFDPSRAKWIIVQAGLATRARRNALRQDTIPARFFERFAADGGDLDPDRESALVAQGAQIRRVPNDHDDIEQFRADIVAAYEDMLVRMPPNPNSDDQPKQA
jgi:hypothetical protein